MRISKKYLSMFIILCTFLSVLSNIAITLGQDVKTKDGSYDETTPYTFKVESFETVEGVEISEYRIDVVAEILEGQDGKPGDTLTITLWDLTDDKKADTITGQGSLAVATLDKEVNPEHEYEVRIVTKPEGRKISGTYEYSWVETKTGGGGIPGFGMNSIVIGLLVGSLLIWKLQRD
jgi:hypothetical protein